MPRRIYIIFVLLLGVGSLTAQRAARLISLDYDQTALRVVVNDLTQRYQLRFVYSADRLPMDYPLTAHASEVPLEFGLDLLFAEAPIRYALIGDQIALKADMRGISHIETLPEQVPQQSPIYPARRKVKREPPPPITHKLDTRPTRELAGGNRHLKEEWDFKPMTPILRETFYEEEEFVAEPVTEENTIQNRLAQISLLPFLSTNQRQRAETVNMVSFNLLVGNNGGVNGVEVGGLFNKLTYDMIGVQIAGLGNTVGGNVVGTQVSGLFNTNQGNVVGAQTAGLFNTSKGKLYGVQVAGLFNTCATGHMSVQVAGLFNANKEDARTQISGLFNTAGNVRSAQVSPLLNVAKQVRGFQLGLINIADSSAMSVGLLNIVRRGYNRIELGTTETLQGQIGLKLGTHGFYNIFQFGARWDELEISRGGEIQAGTFMSWGLGYGIGMAPSLGKKALLNVEAIALHVNDAEQWTSELNLLGQLRTLLELRIGRRTAFFAGPVLNVMWSNLYDPILDRRGSVIVPYTHWERQNGPTNIQAWVGYTAGVRF